jgi:hypothetical protein
MGRSLPPAAAREEKLITKAARCNSSAEKLFDSGVPGPEAIAVHLGHDYCSCEEACPGVCQRLRWDTPSFQESRNNEPHPRSRA